MSKRNKERRAARTRQRASSRSAPPPSARPGGGRPGGAPPPTAEELLRAAVWPQWPSAGDPSEELIGRGAGARTAVDRLLGETLEALWARGWAPADVVGFIEKVLTRTHAGLAAEGAVTDGRRRTERGQTLHPRWERQLEALADRAADAPRSLDERVRRSIQLLRVLARLDELPPTMPRPGESLQDSLGRTVALDERLLARVRALLAKAESTEFDEEAEALTAKAQELIARHAIEEAVLHAAEPVGSPSVRRIPVNDPYADPKAALYSQVAQANRCRVVHSPAYGWVTAFGYAADLDALELLAASLLAQATGAMAREGPRRDALGRSRTRSFRRAFLFGFAQRIGQRLIETTEAEVIAAGSGVLLPVLAARDDQVVAARNAAFPSLVRQRGSVSNPAGWLAGRAAADLADLGVSVAALHRPHGS